MIPSILLIRPQRLSLTPVSGISSSEANNLVAGAPFSGLGTLGSDESTGAISEHIDSVSGISDATSDNDLVQLRNCAPTTNSCTSGLTEVKIASFNIQKLWYFKSW